MKGLAICSKGIEDTAALEVKELIKAKARIKDSCVIFNIRKLEELCLLCYKAQSAEKILFLLGAFELKELEKSIAKIKFDDWLDRNTTFRVSCKKMNNKGLSSEEISGSIGALIIKSIKKYKQKVDLDNPDITFLIFINGNTAYFGVDFSGRDLHKREYKLFAHPDSLRSTIAYSLVRIAVLKKEEVLLDPFCHSGEIPIEAALFISNFPVNYYSKEKFAFLKFKFFKKKDFSKFFRAVDRKIVKMKKPLINCFDSKMMNLNAAKKNAKIAGINKSINFSRMDVEWLDTKLNKESVDKIVTHLPELTRNADIKDTEKRYNEFFYQAEFILKKKGKMVIISRDNDLLKKVAGKYKFRIEKEKEVWCGKQRFGVLVFGK
jgi:23S rRNA G2445 N2-methylase RlmL